ncbi:MAG TPA: GtrA family protein [Egibacteraceae bacterium]|nr:GtrA family protein [Egibacteraceae bacterium]
MTSSNPLPLPEEVLGEELRGGPARAKPRLLIALAKFGVVGVIGTVVNLAVLEVLHGQLGLGFTRSSAIATEVAIIGNYLGNELWTFHHRRISLRRLLQFNLTMLLGAAVQVASATLFKEFMPYLLAQALGICIGSGLNFAFNFGWTWRR